MLSNIWTIFLQGDRTKTVGVVDSEYIVHLGVPTLGVSDGNKVCSSFDSLVQKKKDLLLATIRQYDLAFTSKWSRFRIDFLVGNGIINEDVFFNMVNLLKETII